MQLISWNVAGLRAALKRGSLDFLSKGTYDLVCLQETKALEDEVQLPEWVDETYPFRFWNSCRGEGGQRKGLSGTAIWCRVAPVGQVEPPEFDVEGRTTTLEFPTWYLVTVYTPNSQCRGSDRHAYRVTDWDPKMLEYLKGLNSIKPTIVCGDFNVALEDIDVYAPDEYRGVSAGFLDSERHRFSNLLEAGWVDSLREVLPGVMGQFTYWDQKLPFKRKSNRGWRIDYVLVPRCLKRRIRHAGIKPDIQGSDHCPVTLDFDVRRQLKIVER